MPSELSDYGRQHIRFSSTPSSVLPKEDTTEKQIYDELLCEHDAEKIDIRIFLDEISKCPNRAVIYSNLALYLKKKKGGGIRTCCIHGKSWTIKELCCEAIPLDDNLERPYNTLHDSLKSDSEEIDVPSHDFPMVKFSLVKEAISRDPDFSSLIWQN